MIVSRQEGDDLMQRKTQIKLGWSELGWEHGDPLVLDTPPPTFPSHTN